MPTTYLDLTNLLLSDFNEPSLTAGNFDSTRSVHQMAKNAINRSVDYIQTKEHTWPFNKSEATQVLTIGTNLYTWPADIKLPDMQSFYIEKDDTIGATTCDLQPLPEDAWRTRYRQMDLDADPAVGRSIPNFVFRTNDAWGVTPNPDKAYTVKYNYWKVWTRMSASTDECSIPTQWDHIVIANSHQFMQKYYNNAEDYDRSKQDGMEMLKDMRQLLIPKEIKYYTGQLDKGGWYAE